MATLPAFYVGQELEEGDRVTYVRYADHENSAKGTVVVKAGRTAVYVRWDCGASGLYATSKLKKV